MSKAKQPAVEKLSAGLIGDAGDIGGKIFIQPIKNSLFGEFFIGALGGVRTHNLLIRSQMLYPIELRVHNNRVNNANKKNLQVFF